MNAVLVTSLDALKINSVETKFWSQNKFPTKRPVILSSLLHDILGFQAWFVYSFIKNKLDKMCIEL